MAYDAVSSLKHTIERLTLTLTNPQITKSVYEVKKLLDDILKRMNANSKRRKKSVSDVLDPSIDAQIREAACKLEDFLKSYGLHHSLPPSDEGFRRVEEEIHLFMQTVKKHFKSTMVGLSDQFNEIKETLLHDRKPDLKTVALYGMAGIGKTRLAKEIYDFPFTANHFRVRVWVIVGSVHDTEKALVDIASQIERELGIEYVKNDSISLGENIFKNLFGRRYFIVLDDVWSGEAYRDLKAWFPEQSTGSRLLLTTRLEEEAKYAADSCVHQRLLNNEESWNLLCQNVFGEDEICPDDLEKSGRKIADLCEGLPLLILEVAHRLLSRDNMSESYWNNVANKQTKLFSETYVKISEVLLKSYAYLPQYLKACFLYMGAFPQNCEIPLPKLINLWTVDDFLKPNQSKTSLQDFGIECLEKLVSQSLVFIGKDSSDKRIKSSKLHSAYWHLCVMEARKNNFMNALITINDGFSENPEIRPRLSVQNSILFRIREVHNSIADASLQARTLLCTGQYLQYPVPVCLDYLRLLEVLDALAIRFYEFPDEVLNLIKLKYLALTHNGDLPSFISKLQNLQSLIVRQHHKLIRDSTFLPKEIWDMHELRHLRIMGSNLPDPSNETQQLPNLLTLYVKGQSCTEEVFRSTPRLKKLGIKIELRPRSNEILNCFEHISILSDLESLKCVVVNPRLRSQAVAPPNPQSSFPTSLKKMSLNGIGYSWEYMSLIGSLPILQVLKLRRYAFRGHEWETKMVEFPKLEYLLLEDIDLQRWTTDGDKCFPNLKRLIIRHCYKLEKIPSEIGGFSPLETIEIVDCMVELEDSVREIKEEEDDNREYPLPVPIISSWRLR